MARPDYQLSGPPNSAVAFNLSLLLSLFEELHFAGKQAPMPLVVRWTFATAARLLRISQKDKINLNKPFPQWNGHERLTNCARFSFQTHSLRGFHIRITYFWPLLPRLCAFGMVPLSVDIRYQPTPPVLSKVQWSHYCFISFPKMSIVFFLPRSCVENWVTDILRNLSFEDTLSMRHTFYIKSVAKLMSILMDSPLEATL